VVLDVGSWWAPWGPGFQCSSPQHRFPPISLDLPMFLSWTESGFSPGFPCQYSIGVITYLKTISSWWRHQNFPTRLLKQGNGNADNPQRWIQAFISISGFIIWLAIPPVLHELTWLVTSSRQRLTRIRNKKTLQPYESGIDGAIRQWLARVVLPRVLRFPPTKRFNTKEMVLLRVLRFPSTKRIR